MPISASTAVAAMPAARATPGASAVENVASVPSPRREPNRRRCGVRASRTGGGISNCGTGYFSAEAVSTRKHPGLNASPPRSHFSKQDVIWASMSGLPHSVPIGARVNRGGRAGE